MKKIRQSFAYLAMVAFALAVTSCDKGDDDNTKNPAEVAVAATKGATGHDSAILLCSFGSTFEESIKTYNATIADYKEAFPEYDIYMSFTSRTCVNRVEASLGTPRYQPDLWLNAIGDAGYKNVIIQSLHVIPGEEYLSLMNTDVKKNFMIANYPSINIIKGDCLLEATGINTSTDKVADILADSYSDVFENENELVLFMGHGNPDINYAANNKYLDMETALKANSKVSYDNVIVGTVDYGATVFWPWEGVTYPTDKENVLTDPKYNNCVYAEVMNYCAAKNIKTSDLTITLVPFMTVAGDHAHNDLWGVGEDLSEVNTVPGGDASWKAMLEAMGCNISDRESHGTTTATCEIKGLCDHAEIRKIWIDRLKALVNDNAWENGEDYQ